MRKLLAILTFTILYTAPNKNDFNELFINVAENGSPCIVSIISEKIEKNSNMFFFKFLVQWIYLLQFHSILHTYL